MNAIGSGTLSVRSALVWSFAERYASLIVTLASTMLLARLLTPAQIGVFSLCASVTAVAGILRDFGVSEYLNQEKDLTDEGWEDQIWNGACAINSGKGAAWLLPLAALAVTGCRPASLERGIEFSIRTDGKKGFLEARIQGVKITSTRGQSQYSFRWSGLDTHREAELLALAEAVKISPNRKIIVKYDAPLATSNSPTLGRVKFPQAGHADCSLCDLCQVIF